MDISYNVFPKSYELWLLEGQCLGFAGIFYILIFSWPITLLWFPSSLRNRKRQALFPSLPSWLLQWKGRNNLLQCTCSWFIIRGNWRALTQLIKKLSAVQMQVQCHLLIPIFFPSFFYNNNWKRMNKSEGTDPSGFRISIFRVRDHKTDGSKRCWPGS